MNRQKPHQFRPRLYDRHESASGGAPTIANDPGTPVAPADNERRSWDAYRRWLARRGERPAAERTPPDHSIYSWKGYQNWADKVRQSWKPEEG